jgi:hypothetical protein
METKKCQKLIDLIPEIDKRNIWYASAFIASAAFEVGGSPQSIATTHT